MAQIDCWGKDAGRLSMTSTDERMLNLVKGRTKTKCRVCEKVIPRKSYSIGGGYTKVCLNCYEKFLNNFIKSIDDYKQQAQALIKEIKSKSTMLNKNNILAKVGDNSDEQVLY